MLISTEDEKEAHILNNLSIIIPAHNEENSIGQVIDKIRQSKYNAEIIVVDNCSTDKTTEIAKSKNAVTIYCGNQGKGYAMEEGLKHATGDIILFMDADIDIYEDDIIKLMVEPIMKKNVDFTKSAFYREGGRVTELVAKPLLELLFKDIKPFEQPLSGIIAGKKELLQNLVFEKDYGVDIGILLDMINMNVNLEEVYIGRIDNTSQAWKCLPKMAKEVANAILKRANYIK